MPERGFTNYFFVLGSGLAPAVRQPPLVGPMGNTASMSGHVSFPGRLSIFAMSEGIKLVGICADEERNAAERFRVLVTTRDALHWADQMAGDDWEVSVPASGTIVVPWFEADAYSGDVWTAAAVKPMRPTATYSIGRVSAWGGACKSTSLHATPFFKDGPSKDDDQFLLAHDLKDLAARVRRAAMQPWLSVEISRTELTRALTAGLTATEVRSLIATQGVHAVNVLTELTLSPTAPEYMTS